MSLTELQAKALELSCEERVAFVHFLEAIDNPTSEATLGKLKLNDAFLEV